MLVILQVKIMEHLKHEPIYLTEKVYTGPLFQIQLVPLTEILLRIIYGTPDKHLTCFWFMYLPS